MDLLSDRDVNECYLTANPGESYVLYFPKYGEVKLDLTEWDQSFDIKWINLESGEMVKEDILQGGQRVTIKTINDSGYYAVLMTSGTG